MITNSKTNKKKKNFDYNFLRFMNFRICYQCGKGEANYKITSMVTFVSTFRIKQLIRSYDTMHSHAILTEFILNFCN